MPPGPIQKKINWEEFDKLCAIQCTREEIAEWFGISERTLMRICHREKQMDFDSYAQAKRRRGHVSLRRKQWLMALNGNVPLIIWLSKQFLGQRDKHDVNAHHDGAINNQQPILDLDKVREQLATLKEVKDTPVLTLVKE